MHVTLPAFARSAALLAAITLAAPAFAATPIDETRPLDARGSVEISNVKGRIEVRAWDRQEVRVTGSLGDGVERLEISGDRRGLEVKVRYPRNSRNAGPTTLVVDVPRQADIEIDGVAVTIDVNGVAGDNLDIESVSGSITAVGAPRNAKISSVSGGVRLNLNSDSVDVESVSGSISLRGRITGQVEAETVSGRIDIDTRGEQVQRMSTSSVSGSAELRTGLAQGGRISAESVSGSIRITAPRSLSANVRGESFSGRLSAPGASISKPKYGPGSSFEHRYGSGDGEINIETFSGSAELRLE
ncbi:hypothetical protein E2F46_14975 [Luteimonas aestuarii]|uniref:DUF4097 domain-containing protein n=1 Tax=Luteimonas aestuarii TaxID=453837 RepID=A0A4R5TNI5_9GAMM|nr:DUF4097 family beta strand repeat-containing protein [Luteimonas aestuarii]TDK21534.1 hypothetical protein E2F46_14975 [Luteimonas aestuarii]